MPRWRRRAAAIRKLAAEGKCRYRDIGVGARNMGDYEFLLESVFERYGIPVYQSRRSDILENPALSSRHRVPWRP